MKNIAILLLVFVLGILVFVGLTLNKKNQAVVQKPTGIESVSGLDTVSKQLDGENLNQIDQDLDSLSLDSTSF